MLLRTAAAALLLLPASAGATTFKVVSATHTSSSSKSEQDYAGTSTATWKLAKPSKLSISRMGSMVTGLGQVHVRGTYTIDATTSHGHCAWSAPTGSSLYPLAAPQDFSLAIGPDPRTGKGILASFGAVQASLSNAYLGSECSTSVGGEPSADETSVVALKPTVLKKKTITLRRSGATNREGINYRWSTRIVLKRTGR